MTLPFLDLIESQMIANRLPLIAVSVAAVPHGNTPVVLTLHWHGFVEVRLAEKEQAQPIAYQSVPSSALQINAHWENLSELDWDALETAWELGAWNLQRHEARPFKRLGAPDQEMVEGKLAFGAIDRVIEGESPFVAEVPDADDLIEAAGRAGYVQWLFRPVRGGLWSEVVDDVTLQPGGYRNPPCPLVSEEVCSQRERKVVYQFGRSQRFAS